MFAFIAILALASVASAFDNRDGRTGELRVVNLIGNFATSGFSVTPVLNDNDDLQFRSTQTLRVQVDYDDVQAEIDTYGTGAVAAQAARYERVNLENASQQLNITLPGTRQGSTDIQNVEIQICNGLTINRNKRTTLIVKARTSVNEDVDEGQCVSLGNNNCGVEDDVVTPAEIDFDCFLIQEDLDTESCTDVDPVNIHRFDPLTCDQFITRTSRASDSTVSSDEVVIVGTALAASPTNGNPDERLLDNSKTYTIRNQVVMPTPGARVHDFFWAADSGAVFVVDSLTTGRVGILNAAYRTNGDSQNLQLANDFRYTITTSNNCNNFVSGACVVHAGRLNVLAQTNLIELESGISYTLRVFEEDATDLQIFGDVETDVNPTANAIATQTFTLATGGTTLLVLEGGSAATSTSLSVTSFPIASSVDEDTTDHTIVNLIQNQDLQFAAPSGDCCNFLSDNELSKGESQTFNSADVSGTFDAYEGGASCGDLSSSLLDSNVITIDNDFDESTTCGGRQVHFLIGRRTVANVQVSADVGSCTIEDCNNNEVRISRINEAGGDDNDGITVRTFVLPQCACNTVSTEKCDNDDTCNADEFAALSAKLDALSAQVRSVSGVVTASASSTDKAIDKVRGDLKNLESDIDDLGDDIESEIDDLSAKIN